MMCNNEERAAKVAQVIAEHPGLPMICLAPSTSGYYDSYYHNVTGARVCKILFSSEIAELYGDFYGLEYNCYYDDIDDVSECIEDYWLWENEHGQFWDEEHQNLKCYDWVTDGWTQTYHPIACMMAEDMPWHDVIVIDCY